MLFSYLEFLFTKLFHEIGYGSNQVVPIQLTNYSYINIVIWRNVFHFVLMLISIDWGEGWVKIFGRLTLSTFYMFPAHTVLPLLLQSSPA